MIAKEKDERLLAKEAELDHREQEILAAKALEIRKMDEVSKKSTIDRFSLSVFVS